MPEFSLENIPLFKMSRPPFYHHYFPLLLLFSVIIIITSNIYWMLTGYQKLCLAHIIPFHPDNNPML